MTDPPGRLETCDPTVLAAVVAACSFYAATALAAVADGAARWALVVATLATAAYVVGLLARRESPSERADRIAERVVGRDRR